MLIKRKISTDKKTEEDIDKTFNGRQTLFFLLILLAFVLVIIKLFYLQWIKHSDTDEYVDHIVYKTRIEKPKRGSILDRNGKILAVSIRKYDISIDTKMVNNIENLKNILEKFSIKLTDKHLKKINERNTHYLPIAYGIEESVVMELKNEVKKRIKEDAQKRKKEKKPRQRYSDFDCIRYDTKYIRMYPEKHMASHVIGIVGKDDRGREGIEKICNDRLTGEAIKQNRYKVGSKEIISDEVLLNQQNAGEDVTLTIDKNLQFILEQELAEGMKRTRSKQAVGIIENPHTGEILAMASLPDYVPGEKIKSTDILRNKAIGLVIEPGSTFKIIVMSACLEENLVKPTDRINCENGKFKVGKDIIRDHEPEKIISAARVIEVSSNIGTAKIALKLGKDVFYQYIKKFGFDSLSMIELNGEEKGILREPSKWSGRSIHTISFGQEISATPLQIANAFSVIANGGNLMQPKILKKIGNDELNDVATIRSNVISEKTAEEMRKILTGVVENGTGKSAAVAGYSVAGKTGTAQKIDSKTKKYSKEFYYASFCGMLPAKNPQLVILVAFDEPKGKEYGYYASSVAAPVFSKIAERAADYLNIPKDKPINVKNKKGKRK